MIFIETHCVIVVIPDDGSIQLNSSINLAIEFNVQIILQGRFRNFLNFWDAQIILLHSIVSI